MIKVAFSCAKEKIFATKEFARICGKCQWYETCQRIRTQVGRLNNVMNEQRPEVEVKAKKV